MSKQELGNISQEEAQILAAALRRVRSNAQPNVFDIHHPETSPNWPRYQHQEFPRIVYHPTKLDPRIENENKAVQLRNQRNPNLPQLDLQHPQPMTRKVENKEELDAARKAGWLLKPPFLIGQNEVEETEDFSADPLAASVADLSSSSSTSAGRTAEAEATPEAQPEAQHEEESQPQRGRRR